MANSNANVNAANTWRIRNESENVLMQLPEEPHCRFFRKRTPVYMKIDTSY